MKLQLDTTLKTIKVEGNVNLKELVDTLERLLPMGVWKEFTLECNTTIVWQTNPIIVQPYYTPTQPWPQPWITWGGDTVPVSGTVTSADIPPGNVMYTSGTTDTYQLIAGVYDVEITTDNG